jgi:hypothetical protein
MKGHTNLATGGDGAIWRTTSIGRIFAFVVSRLVGSREDAWANVSPSAVVERLLLAPEQLRVRVLIKVRSHLRNM